MISDLPFSIIDTLLSCPCSLNYTPLPLYPSYNTGVDILNNVFYSINRMNNHLVSRKQKTKSTHSKKCIFNNIVRLNNSQLLTTEGPSWSWMYGSWIYNYLCNQCLSPLMLWVRILLRRGVLYTTLYDKVCQWIAAGRWFFSSVSSTNKSDCHNIAQILLKVALNTITLTITTGSNIIWQSIINLGQSIFQ